MSLRCNKQSEKGRVCGESNLFVNATIFTNQVDLVFLYYSAEFISINQHRAAPIPVARVLSIGFSLFINICEWRFPYTLSIKCKCNVTN